MSLTKKSDVKNHLSPRHRNGIHLYRPTSQPDATGFPGEEAAQSNEEPGHVVNALETSGTERESASRNVEVLAVSKRAQV